MKKLLVSLFAMLATCVFGTEQITNLHVWQRYPWNGLIDITCEVGAGGDANAHYLVSVAAKRVENNASVPVTTIYQEGKTVADGMVVQAGTRHFIWDASADAPETDLGDVTVSVTAEDPKYLVIVLSAGSSASSYPVEELYTEPAGGFNTDEYKTTKLVLRRIEPGSFKMQGSTTTTLTKPFYMGLFEVTQKQWTLVTGSNPCSSTSNGKGDTYPVHYVSYNDIRGSSDGAKWPSSNAVDSGSFLGKLRARTGISFDLPTEAQWEYAYRAGTTTTYYWGDSMNGNYAWYSGNSSSKTHPVGVKTANAWGLYDMSGNVWEWTRDWYGTLAYGTDPKGASSGSSRVDRGGSWAHDASYCTSSYRGNGGGPSSGRYYCGGFRLSRTMGE